MFLPTRPVIHSRMMGFILSISTIFSLACVSLKGSAHSPMLFTDSDNPLLFCQRPCSRFQLLYITIIFNKLAVLFSLLQCSFCDKCTATKSKLILFKWKCNLFFFIYYLSYHYLNVPLITIDWKYYLMKTIEYFWIHHNSSKILKS